MHIVITGNPVDGFDFFGPFTTATDAVEFADTEFVGGWCIAPLLEPVFAEENK